MSLPEQVWDVIITGAGPVGLALASELALQKTSILVLERALASSHDPWKSLPLGRRGLTAPAIEALHRRQLLDDLFPGARGQLPAKKQGFQFGGHFGGISLDVNLLKLEGWKYVVNGPALMPAPTSLEAVERLFTKRAEEQGVSIWRGVNVADIQDRGDAVLVTTSNNEIHRARYVVGADGAHSTVRKQAELLLSGTAPTFTGYALICTTDGPGTLKPGFTCTAGGQSITSPDGVIYLVDFDGGAFDRSQTLTLEHAQSVFKRVTCRDDVRISELKMASAFADCTALVPSYRCGRILLAGDAAHVHPPIGGQGLNLGIGDAMNLGWKLAYTIRREHDLDELDSVEGAREPSLLDTYSEERRAVAETVLEHTRAQSVATRPDGHGRAVRALLQDMAGTEDGATLLIGRMWGLGLKQMAGGMHALVGQSVPDFDLEDGDRFGPSMRDGKGVALELGEAGGRLAGLATQAKYGGRVVHRVMRVKKACGLRALIVRPDGVVAWAVDAGVDGAADGDAVEEEEEEEATRRVLDEWLA